MVDFPDAYYCKLQLMVANATTTKKFTLGLSFFPLRLCKTVTVILYFDPFS